MGSRQVIYEDGKHVKTVNQVKNLVLGAATLAVLAGCNSTAENEFARDLPCPAVGMIAGTEEVTLFSGRGSDVTDIVLKGEIERVVSECEYDIDDGIIYVNLAFRGSAELGPAASSREITIPTFIALTELNSRVLRKDIVPITLSFPDNQRTTSFIHTIEETKVPYVANIDGSAYEILVGFQLTPEQRDFNRRTK
ncbi:MAG: hypothetical protein RLN89_10485 [Parvibaculum sp.]